MALPSREEVCAVEPERVGACEGRRNVCVAPFVRRGLQSLDGMGSALYTMIVARGLAMLAVLAMLASDMCNFAGERVCGSCAKAYRALHAIYEARERLHLPFSARICPRRAGVVSCRSRRERCRCHGKSGMEESRSSSAWSNGNKRWRCDERVEGRCDRGKSSELASAREWEEGDIIVRVCVCSTEDGSCVECHKEEALS
jgi:hypothetical protein